MCRCQSGAAAEYTVNLKWSGGPFCRMHDKKISTSVQIRSADFVYSVLFYDKYAFNTSTLSSFSHGRSRSLRPKCPYAAVCL